MPYPIERYLSTQSAHGASFSYDGKHLTFLTNITGVDQVWQVPLREHQSDPIWPTQLTFHTERVVSVACSPTQPHLLVQTDEAGNERYQFHLLTNDGDLIRPLTHAPKAIHFWGNWSHDGAHILYSSNERDQRYFDVYEMDIEQRITRLVYQQDGTNYGLKYSPNGQHILVSHQYSSLHNTWILVHVSTNEADHICPESRARENTVERYSSPCWSADGEGIYFRTNRDCQFYSLAYLDLTTRELTFLYEVGWDIEALVGTSDRTRLALCINEDGYSRIELYNVNNGWEQRKALASPPFPRGTFDDLTWSKDGAKLAATVRTATAPAEVWVWDIDERRIQRVTLSTTGGIPQRTFVSPSLIRYLTFDRREVPAFLYLPRDATPPVPFVIHIHGGPAVQARPTFQALFQYLLSCGYGILTPNVRGSTGYGADYQSLDDKRLRMDAVKDIQYAAFWLRDNGYAPSHGIALMGGSYGGFMVLAALTTYPNLWAAGVDTVGIANFVTFLEQTGPWRRKLREAEYGGLKEDREFLEQISPINHVDNITAPLFVIHGANDPRVPVNEAEQIVHALRVRNVPVEYLRFEDEGHGLTKLKNRLIAYPQVIKFLHQHIQPTSSGGNRGEIVL